jgi:DNA-binding NarL/FixJ family response regulator
MESKKIPVLLVDESFGRRDCYKLIINSSPDFIVCGDYPDFAEGLMHLRRLRPEIIIANSDACESYTIKIVVKHMPAVKILIVGNNLDRDQTIEIVSSGAVGFLGNDINAHEIVTGLEKVAAGGSPLTRTTARILVDRYQWELVNPLTKAENRILKKLSNGKTRNQIAKELGVTMGTVTRQMHTTYKKLNVHSRADALEHAKSYFL